jgi:hypothetical protein
MPLKTILTKFHGDYSRCLDGKLRVLLEDDSISEYNLKEIQMYLRRLAGLKT